MLVLQFRLARVCVPRFMCRRDTCDCVPKVVFNLAERSTPTKWINLYNRFIEAHTSVSFFRESEVGDSEIELLLGYSSSWQEAFKNCYVSGPLRARSIICMGRGGAMKLRVAAASEVRDPG